MISVGHRTAVKIEAAEACPSFFTPVYDLESS